ncbi:MAG: ferric reductase-like transmembrane domain-containing protein [Acidobacteriaceae bacterium]|nr:ferric reductase-like transmembrane domain-containing protein [Acidobacteriaceae bacterium]
MSAVDLSSDAGLVAMVLLTVNILLGLILSARYNPVRNWPHRRVPVFDIHNWTAYVALALVLLHPILLLLSKSAGFRVIDILWPLHSPKQTLYNCLGATAFYCVVFVVVTSYFRLKLGSRLWKKLHYVSYVAAGFLFVHGILIDPELKDAGPDLLDGEKILVEVCALLIVSATIWRVRYQPKKRSLAASVRKVDYEAV